MYSLTLCVVCRKEQGLYLAALPKPVAGCDQTTLIASSTCRYDLWLSNNQRFLFLFCTCYKFVLMCLAIMTNTHTFPSHACPNCSGHWWSFFTTVAWVWSYSTNLRDQQLHCCARQSFIIFLSCLDVNWPVKCWEGMHAWAKPRLSEGSV